MNTLQPRAVHAGRRDLAGRGVHVPSIDLSTTNPLADVESGGEAYEALATGGRPIPVPATSMAGCGTRPSPASRTPSPTLRAARSRWPSRQAWPP